MTVPILAVRGGRARLPEPSGWGTAGGRTETGSPPRNRCWTAICGSVALTGT
ncbi:MAG: hypothetical protein MUC60_06885 [Oscillatoria sp. Prado101]|nr:hypothetical protein [Oscillatoria sp. Prado101]